MLYLYSFFFFFNDTATTEIYTLSLHDALPISGAWHVVVLNSGSPSLVPTTATSPQVQWLRADLAAHPARCTLAYWHHPLFDSKDAPYTTVRPLWDGLYGAGVDVVVNAHYAFYERFAPQRPA